MSHLMPVLHAFADLLVFVAVGILVLMLVLSALGTRR